MSIEFGFGFSQSPNIEQAVREAVIEAKRQLNQDRIDLSIIFSTIQYDPRVALPIFRSILGSSKIIGCSTSGIITPKTVETRGISVLCLTSDDVRFGIGSLDNLIESRLKEIGASLAQACLNDLGGGMRNLFLFFTDGQIKNISLMIDGLQEVFGTVFPIIGAGSCTDDKSYPSFQIFEDNIMKLGAVGCLIGGHIHLSMEGGYGWRPLGKPRFVTKSSGNIVHTINDQKASLLYEEYFNEKFDHMNATQFEKIGSTYPLGIYIENTNEYLIRNTLGILPDGSIICQGDVPEGKEIHIMIGNKESCKEAAHKAALEVKIKLAGKKPKLLFVIESMIRLKLFGRSASEEIDSIRGVFGQDIPVIGFYANGEVYPFQATERMKQSYYQNESIVIVAIN